MNHSPSRSLLRQSFWILFTHDAQRVCSNFESPQASHRVRFVLSSNALPTNCLFRFFEWDVFFFGTARRIESHRPVAIGTMEVIMGGRVNRREGKWEAIERQGARGPLIARWNRRMQCGCNVEMSSLRSRENLVNPRNADILSGQRRYNDERPRGRGWSLKILNATNYIVSVNNM